MNDKEFEEETMSTRAYMTRVEKKTKKTEFASNYHRLDEKKVRIMLDEITSEFSRFHRLEREFLHV
jgi:hypothetical protein